MFSEVHRIRSVKRFLTLNLDVEKDLQGLLALASSICNTPVASLSLLDKETNWLRVRVGTDCTQLPREIAFCNAAIQQNDVFIVPDLAQDSRFIENPLVTGEPHFRFYAGAPLIDTAGHHLGMLCVVDHQPRQLTDEQIDTLRLFSSQIMRLLELKLSVRLLEKRNQRIEQQKARILAQTAALQEIAAIQSHEVRSPVASILGLVNLIQIEGAAAAAAYLPMLEEAATLLDKTIHKTVGRTSPVAAAMEPGVAA